MTLDYPYRARFFPLIVICLCGILVLFDLMKILLDGLKADVSDKYVQIKEDALKSSKQDRLKFFLTIGWIGMFALLVWLFGFFIGLPLFVLAYVKTNEARWKWAIILPTIMFVIVYIGFGLLLKRPLYEGFLYESFFFR